MKQATCTASRFIFPPPRGIVPHHQSLLKAKEISFGVWNLPQKTSFCLRKNSVFCINCSKELRLFFDSLKKFPLLLLNFDGGLPYLGGGGGCSKELLLFVTSPNKFPLLSINFGVVPVLYLGEGQRNCQCLCQIQRNFVWFNKLWWRGTKQRNFLCFFGQVQRNFFCF